MPRTIDILKESDHFIVFNKPAGLLMLDGGKNGQTSLVDIVNAQLGQEGQPKLHPCHRLDKETSGCVLFAKGKKNQQLLMTLFQEKKIRKTYIAFIQGQLQRLEGVIKRPIRDHYQRTMTQNTRAKNAETRYKVIKEYDDFTVVDVEPMTGRTNQIRIHFKDIDHPLVGENKYVYRREFDLKFKRTALHAAMLSWKDPILKKQITVACDIPTDMKNFLEKHKQTLDRRH